MWNGIKVDGKLFKGWYSMGQLRNYPQGTITIYASEYDRFPIIEGLQVQNDSDSMTDYFEKDRIRVTPDNPHYEAVKAAYEKRQAHIDKMRAKKYA
jgi:hypothetical protein